MLLEHLHELLRREQVPDLQVCLDLPVGQQLWVGY